MGYLPSFLPTEFFVTPRQEGVFGISQNSYLPFSTTQVSVGGGFQNQNQNSSSISINNSPPVFNVEAVTNKPTLSINDRPPVNVDNGNNSCSAQYAPVCANGKTYGNACQAKNAGFNQYTEGECATNGGGDNGNGGGNQPVFYPETGCIIQGFDNLGNPIYIDQNGNPSLTPEGCQISPDFNSGGGGDNGNGGGGENGNGGGGTIRYDEKIIAFVKKNWMYLLAVTAGIYLLTNKSN